MSIIKATRAQDTYRGASEMKLPKSKRGAARQYSAIISACRRDLAGGLSFGMDWPTIRATFPERYAHIQTLKAIYQELPQ